MTRSRPGRKPDREPLSKERLRTWLRLLKASRLVEGEIRERLRRAHGTTLPRFDVLSALERNEHGLTMSALSDELKVSNGNVTGIVDRLAAEGLVVRVPVEGDRRSTLVRLTKKGEDHFAQLAEAHEAWVNDLLGPFDRAEMTTLMELLERVSRPIDEDAAP